MGTVDFNSINIGYKKDFGDKIPEDSLLSQNPQNILEQLLPIYSRTNF